MNLTDEQVVRVLAEFEYPKMEIDGQVLYLKAEFSHDVITGAPYFPIPDYLRSLDVLKRVERKLFDGSDDLSTNWGSFYIRLRRRSQVCFVLPDPMDIAYALAEAIVEAGLVEVNGE